MKVFFKQHYRKIGWILVVLELMSVVNGIIFFLGIMKFSVVSWLAFNACTPTMLFFVAGFIARKDIVMAASVPLLLFFGGSGLFVFGWSGAMIFAQVSHILMVLSVIYLIVVAGSEHRIRKCALGFLAGILLFAATVPFQQIYVRTHPEFVKMMGDPVFEAKINAN